VATLLRAAAASLALCLVFALLSLAAASRDPGRIAERLRPLAEAGRLFDTMGLPLGARRVAAWEGNDCLVFAMLVQPREGLWRDAYSPLLPVRTAPRPENAPAELVQSRCALLAELLDPAAAPEPALRYHRYLHGQRVVGALLVPALGGDGLRAAATLALAGTLGGLAIVAGISALRRRCARDAGFAWLGLGLLLFWGLPIYGRYWSHATSDLVIAGALWLLWLRPAHPGEPDAGPAWLLGGFGCGVALFEFLTGGLPLGAALVVLAAALAARAPTARGVLASLACFGLGAVLPFALKVALGLLGFADLDGAGDGGQLLHRLIGPVVPELSPREVAMLGALGFDVRLLDDWPVLRLPYAAFRLGYFGFVGGSGSTVLGLLVLGGAAAATVLLGLRAIRRGGAARALTAWLACGVVAAWYLLFLSHTLLHAAWMVRCLVVLPLAAGVLVAARNLPRAASAPQ